jgi:hypothetical protein
MQTEKSRDDQFPEIEACHAANAREWSRSNRRYLTHAGFGGLAGIRLLAKSRKDFPRQARKLTLDALTRPLPRGAAGIEDLTLEIFAQDALSS